MQDFFSRDANPFHRCGLAIDRIAGMILKQPIGNWTTKFVDLNTHTNLVSVGCCSHIVLLVKVIRFNKLQSKPIWIFFCLNESNKALTISCDIADEQLLAIKPRHFAIHRADSSGSPLIKITFDYEIADCI